MARLSSCTVPMVIANDPNKNDPAGADPYFLLLGGGLDGAAGPLMNRSNTPMLDVQAAFEAIEHDLRQGNIAQAEQAARGLLARDLDAGDEAEVRYLLARSHYLAGEQDVAIVLAAEASEAAERAGRPALAARAMAMESRCLLAAGETQAALDQVLLVLDGLERRGLSGGEAEVARQSAVTALAVVHLELGDLPAAQEWCQRSLDLARQLPDRSIYGATLDTLACVHSAMAAVERDAGRMGEAQRLERVALAQSREAVEVAHAAGHLEYETSALLNLAESLMLDGDADGALVLLQDWAARHPDARSRQRSHHRDAMGQVLLAQGDAVAAVAAFEDALADCGSEGFRAVVLEHLSLALERCERWHEALQQYKRFHAVHIRVGAERAQRNARIAAARIDIERERARSRHLTTSNTELRRRAEDLARQAGEDVLTGLPNRRRLEQELAREPQRLSLVLIDVDHFKRVNDRYSHVVGDRVLQALGAILRDQLRPRDLPARLGGEEFVILFSDDSRAGVAAAAERIRAAVEAYDWSTLAEDLRLTVSLGVALSGEADSAAALMALADQRLYAAKHAGRNRVVAG